jgi:Ca-activated chloride channel family protein
MVTRILFALMSVFAAFSLAPAAAQNESGDSILVIDASGSMWGRIEGEAKIVIAKRVLGDLLKDLPAERRLGLIAYGHRRTGDCADIEELAAVGAERAAISGAVQKLNPKGKTPMADSIKLAAEKLKYTENKATVILVSDGIETCVPDPCGVAAALEQAGADFTAHVIGFDVTEENAQAQLRCIAENTGGVFVSAENASQLGAALQETVIEAAEAPPPAANLYLRATELEGGLVIEEGLNWRVVPAAGGEPAVTKDNVGVIESTVAPGAYDVSVVRPSDGLKGEVKGVVVQPNAQKTVTIALTFPVEATVRLEPAGSAVAGTNIKVFWTGPERQGDYVQLSEKGGEGYKTYAYVRQGDPAELRMPVEPGEYEVSYMLGRPLRKLATAPITATPASATLDAPDSAIAGEQVSIVFTGPPAGSGDWITVVAPDAEDTTYTDYAYIRNGSPGKLRMPLEAGDYEIRYVQGGKSVLARKPITVTEALATLDAPEKAGAGETVKIVFTGPPAGSGDWITVTAIDAPANKYNDYYYVSRGSPGDVRMPLEPGDYEIRYVQGGNKVIARKPIRVDAVPASLDAQDTAIAGETIKIAYTGPAAGSGDWITVTEPGAPEGSYMDYSNASRGSPAEVRMPLDAGAYELRYVQGASKVIARKPITVTAASATLDGPASAKVDATVDIIFTGPPAGSGDYITVSIVGSEETKYVNYAYASRGSPVTLRMPKEPGDYELRYIQGNKKLLARRPIKVVP